MDAQHVHSNTLANPPRVEETDCLGVRGRKSHRSVAFMVVEVIGRLIADPVRIYQAQPLEQNGY
jgi:hypothetical protein